MKKLVKTLSVLFFGSFLSFAQPLIPNQSQRKIQVAILFDTSNSMDGLIDQAKARIWTIVNDLSGLRHQGLTPRVEIALFDYGNSTISSESNYIRKQIDLTDDLDVISQKLFGLSTNGGEEYCGAVISSALNELSWTSHPQDLRMIYIAGNEPFNQGKIDYKTICATADIKDINVNTIYCGDYEQGIREFWFDGANQGKGEYFNIDANKAIAHIATPYDEVINSYNDSLNQTYYGYGNFGIEGKNNQTVQDFNAGSASPSAKTERAIVKSKTNYSNASWDLIDAVESEQKDISEMREEELPEEFRGKTDLEKTELIEAKKKEREAYQTKISSLGTERQNYIDVERKKLAEAGESDDFGTSVQKSILKKATELGYEHE